MFASLKATGVILEEVDETVTAGASSSSTHRQAFSVKTRVDREYMLKIEMFRLFFPSF